MAEKLEIKPAVALTVLATLAATIISASAATQATEPAATPSATASAGPHARLATRVFTLKYANATRVAGVVEVFGGTFRPNPDLGVLGWVGPEEVADALADAIARLDVPAPVEKNVEITAHLLGVSRGGATAPELPEGLRGVGEQLRKLLGFESVRLLDSLVIRLRDGSTGQEVDGLLKLDGRILPYQLKINRLTLIPGADGPRARLDGLHFAMRVAVPAAGQAEKAAGANEVVRMDTDVDLRPGVKAVVGKASIGGPDDAVALVMQVELVD